MSPTNGVLHVGIDLGTSRSAVSASNGTRHVIDSYVGWPVDMVARKLVKKPVLIGREALNNRAMLDLCRPLEKGVIKQGSDRDEQAVRELLRHLIGLAGVRLDDPDRPQVRAVVGVPSQALRSSKDRLRTMMQGIADRLMIVSEPFAVAYGVEALLHTMIIDIGAGTTDLCVMHGRYPTEEDQRTLEIAGDTVDMQLSALVREQHPEAQFSIHMVREWKEKWSFVGEPSERVTVSVPVAGKPTSLVITNEMRSACEHLLHPLTEAMLNLLARVEPEYQEQVRNNIILAGGGALISGIGQALQQTLNKVGGGRVQIVPDVIFAGSDGGLAIAMDAADADWDQLMQ